MSKESVSKPGGNTGSQITVAVNPKIFPLDVIYSAAYVFLDNYYIMIDGDPEKNVIVNITPKEDPKKSKDIEKRFNNELVNYAFYKKQVEKNADIRKAIMQRALATVESVGNVTDSQISQEKSVEPQIEEFQDSDADFIDDPEGIAIPWEEKFGKKGNNKAEKKSDGNDC